MSYILEALRKADADRERGTVPDLHAQLLPGASADDEPEAPRQTAWRGPALIAALLAVGACAWLWFSDVATPVATVQPAPLPQPTRLPAEPVVPPARPAAATTAAAAAAVAPLTPPGEGLPPPAPATGVAKPAAAKADKPVPAPAPRRRAEAAMASTTTANAPTATAATLPAAPQAALPTQPVRVPPLNELPDELRSQVPPLAIGGSVYSPQAERRMVVVNGQVFQEGATLAPELQLQQIRPKSAVFSIRGQRFELPL